MTTQFLWRLPTTGDTQTKSLGLWDLGSDGRPVGYFPKATTHLQAPRDRFTYLDHVARVAKAAEAAGFHGVLLPADPDGEEPWVVASALIRETRLIRFLPSFHTANFKPVHGARITATAQRHSGDRFDWNIVSGEIDEIQRRYGDFASREERYARTAEFAKIARGVLTQKDFDFAGKVYQVEKGGLEPPLSNVRSPTVYLSGSSETALSVAVAHADVYVTWLEPLESLRRKIADLRARADAQGRTLRFGVRVDVLARATDEEAWRDAQRIWETAGHAGSQERTSAPDIDSETGEWEFAGKSARAARFEDTILGPQLWATESFVRSGPTLSLVGSYAKVAETLKAYRDLGIDTFLLAASPHFDEAYRLGAELLPLLQDQRGVTAAA